MEKAVVFRPLLAALSLLLLAACDIVDTGTQRIGGTSCGFSDATPGTPEYRSCTSKNTHNPRTLSRTPGGSIF